MADPKRVDSGGGLNGVAGLLSTLGGQKSTTTNTGDASGLYNVQGALQNQNFDAMLASIFQQAAGQLPGLQSRVTNAVGARSGNNGSLQALLQKTLAQTTIQAQQQIAQQQGQNLAIRGQVAGDIARVTNSPTTKQGLDYGGAIKAIGGLQALSQAPGMLKKGKELFGGLFDDGAAAAPELTSTASGFLGGFEDMAPAISSADSGMDFSGFVGDAADAVSPVVDDISDYFGEFEFADGGLVGRDKPQRREIKHRRMVEFEEEMESGESRAEQIKKMNDEAKKNKSSSKAKNEYDRDSKMVDQATGIRFADGGQVTQKTAGGRRSSAQEFTPDMIIQALAGQGMNSLSAPSKESSSGVAAPGDTQSSNEAAPAAPGYASTIGKVALSAALSPMAGFAALMDAVTSAQSPETAKAKPMQTANTMAQALMSQNPLSIVSALAKLAKSMGTGESTSGGFNSIGQATGVNNSNGYSGLSAAVSGEGAFGLDAASGTGIDLGTALGVANGPQSSLGAGVATDGGESGGLGLSSDGFGGYGFGGEGLGGFGVDAGGAGFGNDGGYGFGGDGDGDGGGGYGRDGDGGGDGGGDGAKNGGSIQGRGTGTSDSIPIKVSDGEYIVSADVVQKLGVNFFDELQKNFHMPVADRG